MRAATRTAGCSVSIAVLTLVACGCELGAVPFRCDGNHQCVQGDQQGDCEANGFCSFPDAACESLRRYGEHVDEALSGACVPICVRQIALGERHGCLVRTDGAVLCWGEDDFGQLGRAATGSEWLAPVTGVQDASVVALGDAHTCAIVGPSQELHCWGDNRSGQTSRTSSETHSDPEQVDPLTGVSVVALGSEHSCAIHGSSPAELSCWGRGDEAALGVPDPDPEEKVPQAVSLESEPVDATARGAATCAALETGPLVCWGMNDCDRFALGIDPVTTPTPVGFEARTLPSLSRTHLCGINNRRVRCNGQPRCTRPATSNQLNPTAEEGPQQVVAGRAHHCALSPDGAVDCWGQNNFGQLGLSTDGQDSEGVRVPLPLPAVEIAAGWNTTCARTTDGRVLCWGSNEHSLVRRGGGGAEPISHFVSDALACP